MRNANLGVMRDLAESTSEEITLQMYETASKIRFFEHSAKHAFDKNMIKAPIYLSIGQEFIPAALATVYGTIGEKPSIFGQHRGHGHYIAFGGDLNELKDELLHRETGCARGMGGSASIHSPKIKMFGHDGHMGTQVPIATGYALGKTGEKVLAIAGDASIEEDYAMTAMGYAATRKLPILFVCENNDRSILTKVKARRNWDMASVVRGFGMQAYEIADDPWTIMHYAEQLQNDLPAFLDIHTARDIWHAGTGNDGDADWNRAELVDERMKEIGLGDKLEDIESQNSKIMDQIWEKEW
tara:strand:- start:30 stop:923 length:894 start_codon:yes stop_codon:yes gene_type:complete